MNEQNQNLHKIANQPASALFLDRDGVINHKVENGYVLDHSDFIFIDGALIALVKLSKLFNYIFIVTNQQCIGKELLTLSELDNIHNYMRDEIEKKGGRITDIFVASELESDPNSKRKPTPAMAFEASKKYPLIKLEHSIMVGDLLSDIQFGKSVKMTTVAVGTDDKKVTELANYSFGSLQSFAEAILLTS